MITFLWMLYLAFTLFATIISIRIIFNLDKSGDNEFDLHCIVITCFLWSIWYFYYLK